jgi:AcrR family transcriptional regulator
LRHYKTDGVRAQRAAETRLRLLDTAKGLFIAQGSDAVSVSTIAQEAGVALGTIFHHFQGKPGLMGELWMALMRDTTAATWEAMPLARRRGLRAALHAGFDAFIPGAFENLPFWRLGLSVSVTHPEVTRPNATQLAADYAQLIAQVCGQEIRAEDQADFAIAIGTLGNAMMRRALALGMSKAETLRQCKRQADWLVIAASAPGASRPRAKIESNSPA